MNEQQLKYIHIVKTNVDGKWKSIALSNLSKELSSEQCIEIYREIADYLRQTAKDRYNTLVDLKAPAIILTNQKKLLDKVDRPLDKMVHSNLNPLKQVIKKFNKSLPVD